MERKASVLSATISLPYVYTSIVLLQFGPIVNLFTHLQGSRNILVDLHELEEVMAVQTLNLYDVYILQ